MRRSVTLHCFTTKTPPAVAATEVLFRFMLTFYIIKINMSVFDLNTKI